MVKTLNGIRQDTSLDPKIKEEKLNEKFQEYMQETGYAHRTISNWTRPTRALQIEMDAKIEQTSSAIKQHHLSTTKEESHSISPTSSLVHNDKCICPVALWKPPTVEKEIDSSLR